MVGSTLGVYNLGLIFVSARTNKRHHHQLFLNAGSRGIFDRCFSNTNALPRNNIGADVWGESNIMTGVF
jgi:hypothetical protein